MKKVHYFIIVMLLASFAAGYFIDGASFALILVALSFVSFIQNMTFTLVSRSRNGGDPEYHRYAAWGSNGVWLLTQVFIAANVYTPISGMVNEGINAGDIMKITATFFVYSIATAEGSVFMMKLLLGKIRTGTFIDKLAEKGERQVGAR